MVQITRAQTIDEYPPWAVVGATVRWHPRSGGKYAEYDVRIDLIKPGSLWPFEGVITKVVTSTDGDLNPGRLFPLRGVVQMYAAEMMPLFQTPEQIETYLAT